MSFGSIFVNMSFPRLSHEFQRTSAALKSGDGTRRLRNVHHTVADSTTATACEKRLGVLFDGLVIPFGTTIVCELPTPKDEARVHQFGREREVKEGGSIPISIDLYSEDWEDLNSENCESTSNEDLK